MTEPMVASGEGKRIERVTEDDEVVAKNSSFHMERMDDDHIWFQVDGIAFDLYAVRSGLFGHRLVWRPQMQGEWTALALAPGSQYREERHRVLSLLAAAKAYAPDWLAKEIRGVLAAAGGSR